MLQKLNELKANREEGFTLIELLVVIVIIGVLAAIALPIFLNQQKAAAVATVKSDVRNTVAAVATYLVKDPTATEAEIQDNVVPVLTGDNIYSIIGDWDSYQVGVGSPHLTGSYDFNSTTGKYTAHGADYL